jgi:DNA-binding NarL/FixJ family response regulator
MFESSIIGSERHGAYIVNLPTIVVCEEVSKVQQIDTLIKSQPELVLLGTIEPETAQQENIPPGIRVVWVELAPEPKKSLSLLGLLKDKYPSMNFLVSYETLEADLVKTAMQLGAIEYLDSQSAPTLLPEAIKRIVMREQNAPPETAKPSSGPPPPLPEPSDKHAQTARKTAKMRSKVTEIDGSPVGLPGWLLPSVLLVLLVTFVVVYFRMGH